MPQSSTQTIAILPLGRPTFDVPFAEENLAAMLALLDASGNTLIGPRTLLFDADATRAALDGILPQKPDLLLILQVTFTDATMAVEIARRHAGELAIWAIPEPRAGGRLRLNSFCGLNLAGHAHGLNNREFSWLYADPAGDGAGTQLAELLQGRRKTARLDPSPISQMPGEQAKAIAASLAGTRIGRIGEHPAGFDTCAYDKARLESLTGTTVDEIALSTLFEQAKVADSDDAARLQKALELQVAGLGNVDPAQLERSLKLKLALDAMRTAGQYDAFAIRCWPETFTEYGGAVCGPVSLMGEARIPCACEADVYGALTQLILQRVADAPVFLTDLVDLDAASNTGVVWHCGQAPASMCSSSTPITATIHSNRKMPLLMEFALKPGRVTFMRISQARGRQFMVLAGGEMLEAPKSFTGTSGVVRFDTPAGELAANVMNSGLEHHMALAYAEHRPMLREVAAALSLPILEL